MDSINEEYNDLEEYYKQKSYIKIDLLKKNHRKNNIINIKGVIRDIRKTHDRDSNLVYYIDIIRENSNSPLITLKIESNYESVEYLKIHDVIIATKISLSFNTVFAHLIPQGDLTSNSKIHRIMVDQKFYRLTIIIGKNNSGKTYLLKKYRNDLFDNSRPNCIYIPNKRKLPDFKAPKLNSDTLFKRFIVSLNSLTKLPTSSQEIWEYANFPETLDLFTIEDEQKKPQFEDIFKSFSLIFNFWIKIINKLFQDINIENKLETDREFSFLKIQDSFSKGKKEKFFENWFALGSGVQEILILTFIIIYTQYGPSFDIPIKNQKINEKDWKEFLENPDRFITYYNQNKVILIDEPEVSLHPKLFKWFLNYLGHASESIYVIIATHSPLICDIEHEKRIKLIQRTKGKKYNEEIEISNENEYLVYNELYNPNALEFSVKLAEYNYKLLRYKEFKGTNLLYNKIKSDLDKNISKSDFLYLGTNSEWWYIRIIQNSLFLSLKNIEINLNSNKNSNELKYIYIFEIMVLDDKIRKQCQKNVLVLEEELFKLWNPESGKLNYLHYSQNKDEEMKKKILDMLSKLNFEDDSEYQSLLIFPENTIPQSIIVYLLNYAIKHKIVIVGGIEHISKQEFKELIEKLKEHSNFIYSGLDVNNLLDDTEFSDNLYLNLAIIINADRGFTFQIKNNPVYLYKSNRIESIPHILRPYIPKYNTCIGNISVMICKDFLVNHEILPYWLEKNQIKHVIVPSFSTKVKPFLNKMWEMVNHIEHRNFSIYYANLAEFGGSDIINYNLRDNVEPTNITTKEKYVEKALYYVKSDSGTWNLCSSLRSTK